MEDKTRKQTRETRETPNKPRQFLPCVEGSPKKKFTRKDKKPRNSATPYKSGERKGSARKFDSLGCMDTGLRAYGQQWILVLCISSPRGRNRGVDVYTLPQETALNVLYGYSRRPLETPICTTSERQADRG